MEYLIDGTQYLFPPESARRRRLEADLAGLLNSQGYGEVVLPVLQAYDPDGPVPMRTMMDQAYKLVGQGGRLMVLRPDMTEAVASLASRELRSYPRPIRLFYSGSIFRPPVSRRPGVLESYQFGVEMIGSSNTDSDAEILVLAAKCLGTSGITGFRIRVGHVGMVEAIMDASKLKAEARHEFRNALLLRSLVDVGDVLGRARNLDQTKRDAIEAILGFPDGDEMLSAVRRLAFDTGSESLNKAVDDVDAVSSKAKASGIGHVLQMDFGLLRRLDYYTGMVFEAYAPGCGGPVCGGGRYDGLLRLLRNPEGAVGFALDMEELQRLRRDEVNESW